MKFLTILKFNNITKGVFGVAENILLEKFQTVIVSRNYLQRIPSWMNVIHFEMAINVTRFNFVTCTIDDVVLISGQLSFSVSVMKNIGWLGILLMPRRPN